VNLLPMCVSTTTSHESILCFIDILVKYIGLLLTESPLLYPPLITAAQSN